MLVKFLMCVNTVLFYAYDRHFFQEISTFSTLAIDGSIFLYLLWIPQVSCRGLEEVGLFRWLHQKVGRANYTPAFIKETRLTA